MLRQRFPNSREAQALAAFRARQLLVDYGAQARQVEPGGRPARLAGGGAQDHLVTAKERAALAVIREYAENRKVSAAAFADLKRHFTDTEIIEILALNAFEQFYNALTIPLEIESDELQKLTERAA